MGFFAGLRIMLALDRMSKALGDIATDVIKRVFIPDLKKDLRDAKTDAEKSRIEDLISQYEKYSTSSEFAEIAERVMDSQASRFNLGNVAKEELKTEVAGDFYLPLKVGGKTLMDDLEKHDVKRGPLEYTKYWSTILKYRTYWRMREVVRKEERFRRDEEGDDREPLLERIPGKKESLIDSEGMEEIKRRMVSYVHKHSYDEAMKALFDRWMDVSDRGGADALFGQRKIDELLYKPLMEKYGISKSGLNERMMDLKNMIVNDFFPKELGVRVTDALKKQYHVGSVEIVAREEFRRRFAAWILGVPVPR